MTRQESVGHFSAVATAYAAYRPTYPAALFDWVAAQTPARSLVWDCGAGSGQATGPLAQRFHVVVATDASHAQLAAAPRRPNVWTWAAAAEWSGLRDHSADAIVVAQALHWFDLGAFYAEVKRVARSGALVAVWSYADPRLEGPPGKVLARFADRVRPYWPAGRELVDTGYRTIPFPFVERPVPGFAMVAEWPLDAVVGYAGTWSATWHYREALGHDPTIALRDELASNWGDAAGTRRVIWTLSVRAGLA